MSGIRVGHHDIRRDRLSAGQLNAGGRTVLDQDLVNLGPLPHNTALIGNDAGHALGNRLDPTHGIMHPEFLFEMADKDIHGSHVERVAPDEQRMKRKRHAQPLVLEAL